MTTPSNLSYDQPAQPSAPMDPAAQPPGRNNHAPFVEVSTHYPESDPPPYSLHEPPFHPAQAGSYPAQPLGQPGFFPTQPGPYPTQPGSYPTQPGPYPTQPGSYPTQQGPYPTQLGPYPAHSMGYPGQPVGTTGNQSSVNTVVVGQPGGFGYVNTPYPDNTGAIIFACIVTWCCCCVFGIIAFVYALKANGIGTADEAYRKLRTSTRFSMAGVAMGILIVIVLSVVGNA